MPIFASTVTTVVVFLPIFFVVGIAGSAADSPDHHHRHRPVYLILRFPHGHPGTVLQISQARTGIPSLDAAVVCPSYGVEPRTL